jgi:predicted RNA-binding protein with RPS1 domain
MVDRAKELIMSIIATPSQTEWYEGTVSRIESFGVFVKFMNGYKEGMAHVSMLPVPRGEKIEDHFKVGDPIKVRVVESDKAGKIALSTREFGDNPIPRPRPEGRDSRFGNRDRGAGNRDYRSGNRDRDRDRPPRNRDNK